MTFQLCQFASDRCGLRRPLAIRSRFITAGTALLALTWLALESGVYGESTDFGEALSGHTHPLSVKLTDLDEQWRRITLTSHGNVSDNISINVNVSGDKSNATSQNNLLGTLTGGKSYLTKGQTLSVAGRIYLVAYQMPGNGLDIGNLLQAVATKAPPATAVLTEDSVLPLTLLDVQAIGSLHDIRTFDLKAEIAESQRAAQSLSALLKAQGGSSGSSTNSPPSTPKKEGQ